MRRFLLGGMKLLRAEAGNSNHADIAVTPWLLRNPFDQIVTVPLAASAAIGFKDPARRTYDVHVTARNKKLGVAGFQEAGPKRRPGGLRRQRGGDLRSLQIFVVN